VNSALVRRLRREAKANPAKAGALALVMVVAIWFWAPLVVRWCSPAASPSEVAPAPGAAVEAAAQPSVEVGIRSEPNADKTTPSVPWQQLVHAMEQDPRMQPTRQLVKGRDPFGPSAAELAAAKAREQKETKRAPPPELLPADAGLVLNSTLVGSGPRLALIGGEPYWEGDTVPAPHGSESFRLVGIYRRQVVLERQGKQYGLEIKVTSHDGRDTPLAGGPDRPLSGSLPQKAGSGNSTPRSAKPAAGKHAAPFANVNANE
jgi:hypothetical protein